MKSYNIDENGYYGEFGGAFVPEVLYKCTEELRCSYRDILESDAFQQEFRSLLNDYVGRPSPLYEARHLSELYHARIFLKREDLNHTGAHKINNALGQILLARAMGKTRIIAETGAGQHGVATATVCALAARLHPAAEFTVQTIWCWQALAMRDLALESRNVWKELQKEDLPAARKAVGRIVGRDTERLTAEGVIRAAVETVSENFSDGVAAPMLYMLLGGAPLALMYKSINTMDSMVGYKNEKYLWFGRAAAKLDDAANYIPARISALCWIASAALTGQDWKGAWRIWRRDRRCHASPNSAQTEAACAGSLGVQLAGPAWYFGELYDKPTIGDALRPVETDDILQAIRMMIAASTLLLAVCVAVRLGLCCI